MEFLQTSYAARLSWIDYSNNKHWVVLFVIWPFLALLTALTNFGRREARIVVYIYLVYFGLSFVVDEAGGDALRYATELERNALLPFSDFFKIVGGIYSSEDSVDIYEPLISFLVSRLTDDHRVLFAVFAAVFGFFYLKSIGILYDLYQKNPGIDALIHLLFFCVILPITTINGVRMWTAAWIFFYGAIHVIWYRDARFLILAFMSSLVHFSFLSANVILLIYFIVRNRNYVYLPMAIVSFVLPQIISPFLQRLSLRLGGALQARFEGYTNEDYISGNLESMEDKAWFVKIGNDLVFYYLVFAVIIMQILSRKQIRNDRERNLYSFLLLFVSFVNFAAFIPTLGGRFKLVFFLFATTYLFVLFLHKKSYGVSLTTIVGLFPMLVYAAVAFRTGATNMNAWIFTPGFGVPLLTPVLSVAQLLFP